MANILRSLRIKKYPGGLVQASRALGTDPGNLSRIERGIQEPRPSMARKLAKEFGITLDQVYADPATKQKRKKR